jgi:hypothetical protein
MIRKIYALLALTLVMGSCKNNSETSTCTFPEAPIMDDISISVINTFNYKDYLLPGFYDPANIKVMQHCSPSTPIKVNVGSATRTDSNITVKAISFDNFTGFATWDDCQKFEVTWRGNEKTNFQFYVDKERCGNNCCMDYYPHVVVDGQTLNPGGAVTGDDGRMHILLTVYDPTDTLR